MEGYLAQDVLPTGVRRRLGARSFVLPLVLLAEVAGGIALRGVWEVMTPDSPPAVQEQAAPERPAGELPAVPAPPAVPDALTVPGPVPSAASAVVPAPGPAPAAPAPSATSAPAPVAATPAPAPSAAPSGVSRNPFAPGG